MRKQPSLAAASIANRLAERTNEFHFAYYEQPALDMIFSGRYCTVKGERSGGYVLTGRLKENYDHMSGFRTPVERRLRKGYKPKAKLRAVQSIIDELADLRTLRRHREHVYKLAESRDLDLDRIDKMAEAEGHTIVYDEMTIADCEFWKIELAKFPPKEDQHEATR